MLARRLRVVRFFDPWNSPYCTCPLKFTLNPYTGCAHGCLYCYARSYIRGFETPRPKKGLTRNLLHDLRVVPKGALIELSASSDPYTPPEDRLGVTRRVLRAITSRGFKVLTVTKSDLVVRDADLLSVARSAVAITITTLDKGLASKLEPGAPPPSARLAAVRRLTEAGVPVTVRLDPIIPYINDSRDSVREVIAAVSSAGALQITTSTYKARPDSLKRLCTAFPEICGRLRRAYLTLGSRIHGYRYLPAGMRLRYVLMVREEALRYGLAFASCREGFRHLNTPGIHCDGSLYAYLKDL